MSHSPRTFETRLAVITDLESPLQAAFARLRAIDSKWQIEVGEPSGDPYWLRGTDMVTACDGPFRILLERIADRLRTRDRRTVAASFALRFGWTASAAIGPVMISGCLPSVVLGNVSFRFREDTLFERTTVHELRGFAIRAADDRQHPKIQTLMDLDALIQQLRWELSAQAAPVVEALYEWSGFSRKGSWGMITSSWASQFTNIAGKVSNQVDALRYTEKFFSGSDEIARMRPRLKPVHLGEVTHLYQRRASCCRYYLLPQGNLCASCPLVSDEERHRRNLEWMKHQLGAAGRGMG